jgi:phosphohistidine swiveling domain-containing protein
MTDPPGDPTFTVRLSGTGAPVADVGGKAESLDRMIALDMPVPECGVVTSAGYREFVGAPELRALLAELMSSPVPAPAEHDAARAAVDDAFLRAPMPDRLAAEIEDLARAVGGGGDLAIRSSATAEDMEGASFAGQYRSFLGVPPEGIADAVRLTWASLWHPAPRAYRRFRSLDERDLAMGVILMAMLDPSEAGVLFTVDPGGVEDALRVELVAGLGEALVSGATTPEVMVLPRDDAASTLAGRSPPLGELVSRALAVEAATGVAQDIEWAIENGRLVMLQARPITTVGAHDRPPDPFDSEAQADTAYTTSGIAEMVPGVLSPRVWELNSWALEEALRRLFDRLGAAMGDLSQPRALLARLGGRAALDLDAMRAAVRSVPGGSSEELEREYFGRVLDEGAPPSAPGRGGAVLQAARVARVRLTVVREAAVVTAAARRLAGVEPTLRDLSDGELLGYRTRLVHLATRTMAAEVAVAALATAAHRSVERRLERYLDATEAASLARQVTRHGGGSTPLTEALGDVWSALATDGALGPIAEESDWQVAERFLADSEAGRRVLDRLHAAIRAVGSAAVCGGSTWAEQPSSAWEALVALDHGANAPDSASGEPTSPPPGASAGLPGGRQTRRDADAAGHLLGRREQTKGAVLQVGGLVWRADRELGRRLTERGRLEAVDDVDVLVAAELRMLTSGVEGSGGPTLADIAGRRRRLDEQALEEPLPALFQGRPSRARHRAVLGERFAGWSASPGRFEGPARIVHSAAGSGLQRGEVLVATRTDASWAPLFLLAGAVVVEEGGPLSHAAIVARELGVPAVLNVPGIVDRLEREAGEVTLTVDGELGEVVIHRAGGSRRSGLETGTSSSSPDAGAGGGAGIVPLPDPPDAPEVGRLGVFVTGLIGAGALVSGLMSLTQALGGRGAQRRIQRHADGTSTKLVDAVVGGFEAGAASPAGLPARRTLGRWSLGLLLVAVALGVHGMAQGGVGNPWAPFWRAVSLATAAEALLVVVVLAVGAARWPRVPLVLRGLRPPDGRMRRFVDEALGARERAVAAWALGLAAVLALLVRLDELVVGQVDRWIYEGLDAGVNADRIGPEWIDVLGSSEVMIPVALLAALAVARCRPLAYALPTMVAVAGSLHLGLGQLVPRDRPALGESAGQVDSFPGGFVLEVTLVLGVLPLAVAVLTRRPARWSRIPSVALLAVLIADGTLRGAHWPSDNLAALAIGTAFLVVVHGVARAPHLHERCRDCPTQRRAASRVAESAGALHRTARRGP